MAKKVISDPWQAESDARTLREHAEICSDSKRVNAAQKVLKEQAKSIDQALSKDKPVKRQPNHKPWYK